MARDGKLRLDLVDVYGQRLKEKVDILLAHQGLTDRRLVRFADASRKIVVPDLLGPPNGLYKLEIVPPSYLSMGRFVTVKSGQGAELVIRFAIDARKVVRIQFPAYARLSADAQRLLGASTGVLGREGLSAGALYDSLDDIRRACTLNILAKSARVSFADGRTVLSYLQDIRELRGDRFFATVPKELREDTKNSVATGLFESVSGVLHRPPDGFSLAGSFKTQDTYGNLQLTFFARADEWRADIDIDDASGLGHIFQVLRDALSGSPTHPYNIQQILIAHQELDPGYRLMVAG